VELTEAEMAAAKRPGMPSLEACSCTRDFSEVETGLSEEAAVLEAKRCLRCELGTADGKRWLASRGVK
jgi:hypothetical protein